MKTHRLHELWITKATLLGYTIERFGRGYPHNVQKFILLDQNQHYVCNTTTGRPGYLETLIFDHVWQAAEHALKLQGVDPYEEDPQRSAGAG